MIQKFHMFLTRPNSRTLMSDQKSTLHADMLSLSDLRGSVLIQRYPRPWDWSLPRPTLRWPRTSWLAPRTLLRPSRAQGHNSSAETPVSDHCLCTRRHQARFFPLCHPEWPFPVGGRGSTDFMLFEVTGQLCCSVWMREKRARGETEGEGDKSLSFSCSQKTKMDLAVFHFYVATWISTVLLCFVTYRW